MSSAIADSSKTHASDIASASFGSEVSLSGYSSVKVEYYPGSLSVSLFLKLFHFLQHFAGSGIPCTIAFSNAGIRDIYLIPKARETTGKVLLAEKHPFRSQRGVVLAVGPLAGLNVSKIGIYLLLYLAKFGYINSEFFYFSSTGQ